MEQYLNLLKKIKEEGTHKNAAREGMPGTTSLFGYQFRHNLADRFPLLTTKKMFWKGIVVELLWFLRGDTNIKYLLDNGCNIWNQDAYNYYCKQCKKNQSLPTSFETFIEYVKDNKKDSPWFSGYELGDCGYQYGKVWRDWKYMNWGSEEGVTDGNVQTVDQISNIIQSLKENPESRRHILNSIDPTHQNDLALYWCHALSQFNCRPLTELQKKELWSKKMGRQFLSEYSSTTSISLEAWNEYFDSLMKADGIPKYYLDCQMYQRSADVVLGVPFNIASYALLTHILCKICNMAPGEMIYTYGDVHIYDNHLAAVEEQLLREPKQLPTLYIENHNWNDFTQDLNLKIDDFKNIDQTMFIIRNYNSYPKLENEAELNTGL